MIEKKLELSVLIIVLGLHKVPSRRHTMTFTDLNRLSSTISSLNIFSSASKKQQQQQQQQQKQQETPQNRIEEEDEVSAKNASEDKTTWDKWDWALVKSRLLMSKPSIEVELEHHDYHHHQPPVYLKHGPGYDDFGFVSTSELIKVRLVVVLVVDEWVSVNVYVSN